MIAITITLSCDGEGCQRLFRKPVTHRDTILRRDLESLRSDALARGWARFRIKNTAPNGDYCPACVRKIQAEKPKSRGLR